MREDVMFHPKTRESGRRPAGENVLNASHLECLGSKNALGFDFFKNSFPVTKNMCFCNIASACLLLPPSLLPPLIEASIKPDDSNQSLTAKFISLLSLSFSASRDKVTTMVVAGESSDRASFNALGSTEVKTFNLRLRNDELQGLDGEAWRSWVDLLRADLKGVVTMLMTPPAVDCNVDAMDSPLFDGGIKTPALMDVLRDRRVASTREAISASSLCNKARYTNSKACGTTPPPADTTSTSHRGRPDAPRNVPCRRESVRDCILFHSLWISSSALADLDLPLSEYGSRIVSPLLAGARRARCILPPSSSSSTASFLSRR
mmetsp:Transcript_524/g.1152  ORF Transcript_524/g.1152 Transcript_524/m.1152 type:complete len:319 (-) Transcript_524:167-1123(-)